MGAITRRIFLTSVCLVALSAVALSTAIVGVAADVPVAAKVENISTGSLGKIRVEIAHAGGGASSMHYMDNIEVDIGGEVKTFEFGSFMGPPIQNNPFSVELDLGQLAGTPNVKVRAHCTVHGWGDWSSSVAVPEFPVGILGVFAVTLVATLVGVKRQRLVHG